MVTFTKAEKLSLRLHPTLDEKWVQQLIFQDPSILGLGELTARDKERPQPRAGRLDLLLQDTDADKPRRYEVEVQLGATDETHIIRTLEYWDIERKRYPQYDHCAVIIAEEITSRFLNVISLFNGTVPLIALQMQAMRVGEHTTLVFTKVMDEISRGLVDEDEEAAAVPADRTYWETRGSKLTVGLADELLAIAKEIDPEVSPQFNKHYIGLFKHGQPFNFVRFRPKKSSINLTIRLPQSDDVDASIEQANIEQLTYARWGAYRLSLQAEDIQKNYALLRTLMSAAHANFSE